MKNILMGASVTALTSALATGSVQAAEWDLQWGGFFGAWAAYASDDGNDTNSNDDGFDILQNSEIIFNPSITLDSGLTFGATVELEGNSGAEGDRVDESHIYVTGSFGRLELGSEDGARNIMGYTGPIYGPAGTASGTMTGTFFQNGFQPGIFGGTWSQFAGDAMRINYFTPRFSGFQVGVSYARDGSEERRTFANTDTSTSDIISLGANYQNTFGNVSVGLSGTYEQANFDATNTKGRIFGVGGNVGFGGISLGGSYSHADLDNNNENDFFHAGVGYKTGPWAVSLDGSYSDTDNVSETTQIALNGEYKLGPGVKAQAFAGYAEVDLQGGGDFDGFTIGTGIRLDF